MKNLQIIDFKDISWKEYSFTIDGFYNFVNIHYYDGIEITTCFGMKQYEYIFDGIKLQKFSSKEEASSLVERYLFKLEKLLIFL